MGKAWCAHSSRPHADTWRRIWAVLEDIGDHALGLVAAGDHPSFEFLKIKAHATKRTQNEAAPLQKRRMLANAAADAGAKRGAGMGTNAFLRYMQQSLDDRASMVEAALSFVSDLAKHVLGEHVAWQDVVKLHRPVATAFGMRCAYCFRAQLVDDSPCRPHPIARAALAQLGGFANLRGHRLWRTGEYIGCSRCAAFTKQ